MTSAKRTALMLVLVASPLGLTGSAAVAQAGTEPGQPGSAHDDSAKVAAIRHLIDISGQRGTQRVLFESQIALLRREMPKEPEATWTRLEGLMQTVDFDGPTIAIYTRHFSLADIQQLIAFYESPIGRKFVAEQPAMVQEMVLAGASMASEFSEKGLKPLYAHQKALVGDMKTALRDLAVAEEGYFADHQRYSTSLADLRFTPRGGTTVVIGSASAAGWSGVASHTESNYACRVGFGSDSLPTIGDGVISCK